MTTAHDLGSRLVPWPCELREGSVARLEQAGPGTARIAARIGRALRPAAEAVGAWVSAEALIRIHRDPDTALRPTVAVVAGPLPYDGVVDDGLLLVVEVDLARADVWREAVVAPVWVPQSRCVLVVDGPSPRTVASDGVLRLTVAPGADVAAADLCRVVGMSG